MKNKYYMVINSEDFKPEEGWQETGWILKGISPVKENGMVTITNELERFYIEEEVYSYRLAEMTKEDYDKVYQWNCTEEGWGDQEEDMFQTIYKKYTKNKTLIGGTKQWLLKKDLKMNTMN